MKVWIFLVSLIAFTSVNAQNDDCTIIRVNEYGSVALMNFYPGMEIELCADNVKLNGTYYSANLSLYEKAVGYNFSTSSTGDVVLIVNFKERRGQFKLKYDNERFNFTFVVLSSKEVAEIKKRNRERQIEEQERRLQVIELERQRQEKERIQTELFNKYIKTSDSLFEFTNYGEALRYLTMAEGLDMVKPTVKVFMNPSLKERNNQLSERIEFEKLRKTKVFRLIELDNNQHTTINNSIQNIIYLNILQQLENCSLTINVRISVDTNGVVQYTTAGLEKQPELQIKLSKELDKSLIELKVLLPRFTKYKKYINYESEHYFNVESKEKIALFEVTFNKIITLENNAGMNVDRLGPKGYYPMGLYHITAVQARINDKDYSRVKTTYYKGSGGPANAIYTGVLPWKGYKEVAGKVNKPNSIAPLALFPIAAIFKLSSNSMYNQYLSAVDMNDVSRYYNSANNQHKIAIISGSVAIIYSAYNMGWVYLRGLKNIKQQRQFLKSNPLIQRWTNSNSPDKDEKTNRKND
jgi:hypothetical protein